MTLIGTHCDTHLAHIAVLTVPFIVALTVTLIDTNCGTPCETHLAHILVLTVALTVTL